MRKNLFAKLSTFATLGAATLMNAAHAAGIDEALDSVDLSGIATKVGAAGLVIVAIALVFKGPDVAKRVVKKV